MRLDACSLDRMRIIVLTVATAPAQAERAPFSQAVVDAAISEPDLRYAPEPGLPRPGLLVAQADRYRLLRAETGAGVLFPGADCLSRPGCVRLGQPVGVASLVELFNILSSDRP